MFKTNLYGSYNYSNVCAAIALGLEFGLDKNKINQALVDYNSENNRSEIIRINDKTIILDAYNANPTSMTLAIQSFNKSDLIAINFVIYS